MDSLGEKIWKRGSAREIMREAQRRFNDVVRKDPVAAHVALASVHYSLVKRYMEAWWQKPLAVWHLRRAVRHAEFAGNRARLFSWMTIDQIDVVTTIWRKAPFWLGGDMRLARRGVQSALSSFHTGANSVKPHTRALLLISRGEIERLAGDMVAAQEDYDAAFALVPAIEGEDSPDREYQLVRVLSAVGFFEYDHGSDSGKYWAKKKITCALDLAHRTSRDQEEKILTECRKRGL